MSSAIACGDGHNGVNGANGGTGTDHTVESTSGRGNVMSTLTRAGSVGSKGGLGLASFQRELICSICTEVLYQPLTILNCLHTFCGSCLKEWFSHQHRKASSSRSSSTSASANPYSCPTCRAEVIDVQHNATVSNLLELFLAANPSLDRAQDDKDDMDKIYKPDGTRPRDKILPKVERRRERRTRRHDSDAARERRMVEEARQRSLLDFDYYASASSVASAPADHDANQGRDRDGGSNADREERRQRRRDRERMRQDIPSAPTVASYDDAGPQTPNETVLPASSPRHPSAIEARQREHRMSHQASLRSLVSASETSTLTGDSLDEARIMEEIIDAGLLGDIDIDALDEQEQDALAERIADLYRQRLSRNAVTSRQSPPASRARQNREELRPPIESPRHDRRHRSTSARRSTVDHLSAPPTDYRARSASSRLQPTPPTAIVRSNSHGSSSVTLRHRRRTSDNSRDDRGGTRSRQSSVDRQSASHSASNLSDTRLGRPPVVIPRTQTDPTISLSQPLDPWSQTQAELQNPHTQSSNTHQSGYSTSQASPPTRPTIAEIDGTAISQNKTTYDEPQIVCFRCQKPNLQYELYRHCRVCKVDLCMRCYRGGKGCKNWFGFGHAAEIEYEARHEQDETVQPSHVLIGRQYLRPPASTIVSTISLHESEALPKTTTSPPQSRLQEGRFCDRCSAFANSQFWLCTFCNEGEWGFCKQCVQTHHCCVHPLLPIAYWPSADTTETLLPTLQGMQLTPNLAAGSSRPVTPKSVSSRRGSGYDYLSINVNCDMCHNIIYPASLRYHCPFHVTDYDICAPCYASYLAQTRMRRDSNAELVAGWRKCPEGHRMIMLAFELDIDDDGSPATGGGVRRVIKADLVGGWKMKEADQQVWNHQHGLYSSPSASPPLVQRGAWSWNDDSSGAKRTRTRAPTLLKSKFPPDGGVGTRGIVGRYSYWPDEGPDGEGELTLPSGAEVTEMEDINGDWWSGVYAGDIGVFPAAYVKEIDQY